MKAKAKTEVTPLEAATNERKRIVQWVHRHTQRVEIGDDAVDVVDREELLHFIRYMDESAKKTPGGAQRKRG